MVKEILNSNYNPPRYEAIYPAVVKSINLDSKIERTNGEGFFYRGTVAITNDDGSTQTVQANLNVGAYESNKSAFEVGANVEFVIATRTTGANAGKGGWMSFASSPAMDFTKATFVKADGEQAKVATPASETA